ncbi:MAG: AsmA family protein, partial [Proteobacteria bacterium]|nr:AsmA family protein [Pseudomonadota bacterium]
MRVKYFIIGGVAVVAALVVAGVAILSSTDYNAYRGVVAEQVQAATGRGLAIKGDLKFAMGFSPAVAADDVTFANAAWGSRPIMVQVKRFEAQIELLPLIFGDVKVSRIVLLQPDILLETDAKGVGNWVFDTMKPAAPAKPVELKPASGGQMKLPQVNEVVVRDAKLVYRDGQTKQSKELSLAKFTVQAKSETDPLKLEIDGVFDKLRFLATGELGSIAALSSPGTPFAVKLDAKLPDIVELKVSGSVREPLTGKGYDLTIAAQGAELAKLAELGGQKMAPFGPFKLEAKVNDQAPQGAPSLASFKAELGRANLVLVRAEGGVRDPLAQKGIALVASVEGSEIGALSGLALPGMAAPLPAVPAFGPYKASIKVASGQGDKLTVPELKVEFGKPDLLKLTIDGSVQDALAQQGVVVTVAAEAPDVAAVAAKAGSEAPVSGPLKFQAKLADTGVKRYAMSNLQLKFGPSDVAGEATLSLAQARPAFTANFTSNLVELAKPGQAKPAAKPAPAPSPAAKGDGKVFSNDPLPFAMLDLADGEFKYQAKEIRSEGAVLKDLALTVSLRNGELTARPVSLEVSGGKINLDVAMSAKARSITGKFDGKGVNLGALLNDSKTSDLIKDGKTDFAVDFRGAGQSLRALMASLNGSSTVAVGEGEIESKYAELLGADVVKVLSPLQGSGARTKLNCVVNRFDIKDGLATSRALIVDTGRMTVNGEGTINLGSEELKMMFKPHPKDAAIVSLAMPIRVGGTLGAPHFTPGPLGVLVRDVILPANVIPAVNADLEARVP